MKRRAFIGAIAAAAGLALDPERALWLPRKKLISIPKPRVATRWIRELMIDVAGKGRLIAELLDCRGKIIESHAIDLIGGVRQRVIIPLREVRVDAAVQFRMRAARPLVDGAFTFSSPSAPPTVRPGRALLRE